MPVDESMAWGRVVIPYTTLFATHQFAFHCNSMNEFGDWTVPSMTETTIYETCTLLTQAIHNVMPTGTTYGNFTVYKNNPLPIPTEFWLTGEFDDATDPPSVASKAAWQLTLNARTPHNRKAKWTILDCDIGITMPYVRLPDDFGAGLNSAMNYLCGNPHIVTIDGEDVSIPYSATGTINRTAERRYGKKANS